MLIEFMTTDGKSMWVGSTSIVSIITRADVTVVKLTDGTEWHAAEPAAVLGQRIIDAVGMHMGASPSDARLAEAAKAASGVRG